MSFTPKFLRLTKQNALNNLLFSALFIIIYSHVWKDYCVPTWEAFRYEYHDNGFLYEVIGFFVALLPVVFYRGIKNVSSWIAIFIYFFGYVPIIIGTLYNFPEKNPYHITWYWIILFISMCLYFRADRSKWKLRSKKKIRSLRPIWLFVLLSFLILFAVFHGSMQLVRFEDVYSLRETNAGSTFPLISYFQLWSVNFTFPFVIAYGLCTHNKKLIIIGSLLMLFLYSIFGLKTTVLAPFIIIGLYYFFDWQNNYNVNLIVLLSASICLLSLLLMNGLDNPIIYAAAAVFLMRTVTISGNLFACYYLPFFQENPHTHFTHINIINAITGSNPYHGQPLGFVVSESDMNANAIFWAMDGIAGGGVWGVALVSFLFLLLLYLINAVTNDDNLRFACILFIMPTLSLLNVSLFTFVLSCGALFVILTLLFIDIKPQSIKN